MTGSDIKNKNYLSNGHEAFSVVVELQQDRIQVLQGNVHPCTSSDSKNAFFCFTIYKTAIFTRKCQLFQGNLGKIRRPV